jgi:hypothetical protein
MVKKKKRAALADSSPFWGRFVASRSARGEAAFQLLVGNLVSLSIPGQTTPREQIIQIANRATNPIAVESLSDELSAIKPIRGCTYFDSFGNIVDRLAENFPNMRWWISEKGLNMANLPPEETLNYFDSFAGELCVKHWKDRLSRGALMIIATELDTKALEMKWAFLDSFEPAARKKIVDYNQKHSRSAIKTFERAAADPRFSRLVRRRLYRARERFLKAQTSGLSTTSRGHLFA